ncbi:hypothetical protein [Dietzia sp. 179-F 9C3 NHS]|uniref:hypothetical protein n=1 Tax=Dietzia sp. 179-F 9C3 NHS TaxID=3374295 RepID=UPI00387A250F
MPSSSPVTAHGPSLSRRHFVAVTAGVAGLVAAGGCTLPEPEREPDPLLHLAKAADRDARELAAADASHGGDVGRLRRIGEVRRVHSERLSAEIRRVDPPGDDDESGTDDGAAVDEQAGNAGSGDAGPAAVCPPIGEVRERMRADARRAAEVAASATGYRAELAAAVSAACVAAVEVVLA